MKYLVLIIFLLVGCGSLDEWGTCVTEGCDNTVVVDGKDGRNGVDGANGKDGRDGKDGKDGKDGRDGIDGKNGNNGADGRDGKNGEMGPQGPRGEKGESGKDGSSCSVRKLASNTNASIMSCTDGTAGLINSTMYIEGYRTWHPSAWYPTSYVLNYSVEFMIPSSLSIVNADSAKTGTGWSYIEYDDVRLCYQPHGNQNTNNPPEFKYAAHTSEFNGDCSTIWNHYGKHLNMQSGDWVLADSYIRFGVSGGKGMGPGNLTLGTTLQISLPE